MQFDEISNKVLGCAITVHRELGPGLLESAYQHCLMRELQLAAIPFRSQVDVCLEYKGIHLDCVYRADLIVADHLLVELKCVDAFTPDHTAQILTYLRLTKIQVGLLINFKLRSLTNAMRRFVHSLPP